MEKASTIEELIAAVLEDISKKGFSSVMPFSIGRVEVRMVQFADANGIELASNGALHECQTVAAQYAGF